jgi:hypothetical protein
MSAAQVARKAPPDTVPIFLSTRDVLRLGALWAAFPAPRLPIAEWIAQEAEIGARWDSELHELTREALVRDDAGFPPDPEGDRLAALRAHVATLREAEAIIEREILAPSRPSEPELFDDETEEDEA